MSLIDELEREKAHADGMATMAQHWMTRAEEAEKLIAVLVAAAGGEIIVHRHIIEEMNKLELVKDEQIHDRSLRFRSRFVSR